MVGYLQKASASLYAVPHVRTSRWISTKFGIGITTKVIKRKYFLPVSVKQCLQYLKQAEITVFSFKMVSRTVYCITWYEIYNELTFTKLISDNFSSSFSFKIRLVHDPASSVHLFLVLSVCFFLVPYILIFSFMWWIFTKTKRNNFWPCSVNYLSSNKIHMQNMN
jgi:hypothetical protein